MKRLIAYNPAVIVSPAHAALSGIEKFAGYFKIYNAKVMPVDRTNTLRLPIHTKSLFPMPAFRPFTRTLEDICNDRAKELLTYADNHNLPIKIFYSGGIDSSLVIVSFLKNATAEQLKRITVLMNEDSIAENPSLYDNHIRGKLATDSSIMFPYLLGQDVLIVNGEHNDQLNGSDIVGRLIQVFGPSAVHEPYNRDRIFTFFNEKLVDDALTNFYLDLFEKLMRAAPVEIRSNYDYFWWINFALKWQTVSMRMLPYTAERNVGKITAEYFNTRCIPFYRTDDFQLWSMNNPDKKIKDTWNTYKWACKEIIYDFTKDAGYRAGKMKKGSLHGLLLQQTAYDFIDENFRFYRELDIAEYYNPDNDF